MIVRDSPDVTSRLVNGKVTYAHRRVWLVRVARKLEKQNLMAIREEHTRGGAHRVVETPFPLWVPPETQAAEGRLQGGRIAA
jgi:hypothetical protein